MYLLLPLVESSSSPANPWVPSSVRKIYDPPSRFYVYAPSVVIDEGVERYWACHNRREGAVEDSIYYIERVRGKVVVSKPALTAGAPGAWDSFHVCDPAVIAGKFQLNGKAYRYALFYLGNDVDASAHNQIGVAFTNDLSGNWVKYPDPVVQSPNDKSWGAGQPSATSLDGNGRLLLFYTFGSVTETRAMRRELDLSDMSHPSVGPPVPLTNAGLTAANGNPDFLNNFDVVYDPRRDRFYAVREQHPYPLDHPSYIVSSQQVVSISGAQLRSSSGGRWQVEGEINRALTGSPRNHNAGIERTLRGTLPRPNSIRIVFTDGCAGSGCGDRAEWSYDLWEVRGALLPDQKAKSPLGKLQ